MIMTKDRLQLTRLIRGKREKVFEAWTRPELVQNWFCPEGLRVVSAEVDARVGGKYRISMKGDDDVYTAYGTYQEIVPQQKLVFTWQWDEHDLVETLVTVEFKDKNGGTEITLTHNKFVDPKAVKFHKEGWTSTLENLAKQFP